MTSPEEKAGVPSQAPEHRVLLSDRDPYEMAALRIYVGMPWYSLAELVWFVMVVGIAVGTWINLLGGAKRVPAEDVAGITLSAIVCSLWGAKVGRYCVRGWRLGSSPRLLALVCSMVAANALGTPLYAVASSAPGLLYAIPCWAFLVFLGAMSFVGVDRFGDRVKAIYMRPISRVSRWFSNRPGSDGSGWDSAGLELPRYSLAELLAFLLVVTVVTGVASVFFAPVWSDPTQRAMALLTISATSVMLSIVGARVGIWQCDEKGIVGRPRLYLLVFFMLCANVVGSVLFSLGARWSAHWKVAAFAWVFMVGIGILSFSFHGYFVIYLRNFSSISILHHFQLWFRFSNYL